MRRLLSLALVIVIPAASYACIWDYDTLKQERARFPSTLEIITGKFLRHSPEFYAWRIKDRLEKLKTDPKNPALYDDLAVAYAKTGRHAMAIETMEAVEKFVPGRYETYSNLGTFHFLAGDIPKALPFIDKALAINPDAHFGREKYQRWLGEYLLANPPKTLPVAPGGGYTQPHRPKSFSVFLRTKLGKEKMDLADIQAATKGVLGMMRFADHKSPVLLEVLGDLLWHDTYQGESTGKRLAARAYLKAAREVTNSEARAGYRQLADESLTLQTRDPASQVQLKVKEVEPQFEAELADAEKWYADLKAKELEWIASTADPEAEFDKLYTEDPTVADEPTDEISRFWIERHRTKLIGAAVVLIIGIAVVALRLGRRDRRRP